MAKRQITVPVFVPHLGCPHACVFCDQRAITGQSGFSLSNVRGTIERTLSTVTPGSCPVEIAFFGGSFTAIDRALMTDLLSIAREYRDAGRVQAIRCSTRPDALGPEILAILREYGVQTVEIGVQSLSDRVLTLSGRGHNATCTLAAMERVVRAGFDLVGQMMLGLPGSTLSDELSCARAICDAGAVGARIYPTAVFAGTALHRLMLEGRYVPLSVEEAVERGARVTEIFLDRGVKLLRVGLCETDSVRGANGVIAGGYHPAMGELCYARLYRNRIFAALDALPDAMGRKIEIFIPQGALSKAIGQNKGNKIALMERYHPQILRFTEDSALSNGKIRVQIDDFADQTD